MNFMSKYIRGRPFNFLEGALLFLEKKMILIFSEKNKMILIFSEKN